MELALKSFKQRHPHVTRAKLFTDGAMCYAGKYMALALPMLSKLTGVYITDHHTGEPGKNKSPLDAHFATSTKHVRAAIGTGLYDTTDAATLQAAHAYEGGISATFGRTIQIDRSKVCTFYCRCP